MKKIITIVFCCCSILTSIIVIITGISIGIQAEQVVQDSFWSVFSTFFYTSLGFLFGTAVFAVFMVGICQIVDNLREINLRLSKSASFQIDTDNIASQSTTSTPLKCAVNKKFIDYNNAKCSNCINNIDSTHCQIYDIKPIHEDVGYCDSYAPIK